MAVTNGRARASGLASARTATTATSVTGRAEAISETPSRTRRTGEERELTAARKRPKRTRPIPAAAARVSVSRAPDRMRLSRSRPLVSVPSVNGPPGAYGGDCLPRSRTTYKGSYGATRSPKRVSPRRTANAASAATREKSIRRIRGTVPADAAYRANKMRGGRDSNPRRHLTGSLPVWQTRALTQLYDLR